MDRGSGGKKVSFAKLVKSSNRGRLSLKRSRISFGYLSEYLVHIIYMR
jgi:hypothetical protein